MKRYEFNCINEDILQKIITELLIANLRGNTPNTCAALFVCKRFYGISTKILPDILRYHFNTSFHVNEGRQITYHTGTYDPKMVDEVFSPGSLIRTKHCILPKYSWIVSARGPSIRINIDAIFYEDNASVIAISLSTKVGRSIWVEHSDGKYGRNKEYKYTKSMLSVFEMHERILFSIFAGSDKYFKKI